MPLNAGCSITAFRRNISQLVGEGYPQNQAVAIALSTLRKSCQAKGKPVPDIGEIVPPEVNDEIESIIKVLLGAEQEMGEDALQRSTEIWGVFDYDRESSKAKK
jgi:hypothetical protein